MADSAAAPRPRKKRMLIIAGSVLAFLIVLIGLLPTIASHVLVPGLIRSSIAGQVDGDVVVDGLHLSWFGGQGVRKIAISSSDGATKLDVNGDTDRSLLGLLFGWPNLGKVDVVLSGEGVLNADGSTSFDALFQALPSGPITESSGAGTGSTTAASSSVASSGGIPAGLRVDATVKVPSLRLQQGEKNVLEVKDLLATARIDTKLPIALSLKTAIDSEGSAGSLSMDMELAHSFKADGNFSLAAASLSAKIAGSNVRVPVSAEWADIESLDMSISSDALGKGLTLNGKASGTLGGKSAISMDADLKLGALVTDSGAFILGPDTISGSMHAKSIPTSLLEPFVLGLGVDLPKDLGPTLDASLTAEPGQQRKVQVKIDSSHLTLRADASISNTAISEGQLTIDGALPATLFASAGIPEGKPIAFTLRGEKIALALDSQGRPEFATLAGSIEMQSVDSVVLQATKAITIADFDATVVTTSLKQGIQIDVKGMVNDASIHAQAQIPDVLSMVEGDNATGLVAVQGFSVDGKITSKLLDALGLDKKIGTLDAAVPLRIASKELKIQFQDQAPPLLDGEITATVDSARLSLAGQAEAISINGLRVDLVGRNEKGISLDSDVNIASKSRQVASIKLKAASPSMNAILLEDVRLDMDVVDVALAAGLAGIEPGPIVALIGSAATLDAFTPRMEPGVAQIDLTANLKSPAARAAVSCAINGAMLTKADGTFDAMLEPADLKAALGEDQQIKLKTAVPIKATFSVASLPLDMSDLKDARGSVSLDAKSAEFLGEDGSSLITKSLQGKAALTGSDLKLSLQADVLEKASSGNSTIERGRILFDSQVTIGSGDESTRLGTTLVELKKVPTVLFELAGGDGRMVVAALGETVDAKATVTPAKNGRNVIVANFKSPFATVDLPMAWIEEETKLVVPEGKPLNGKLIISPSLSSEILSLLHPIFADVSTTKKPIRLTVGPLEAPLDENMKVLNGEADLVVGEVTLKSTQVGSQILSLLEKRSISSLDAMINPLKITAKDGMVEYSNFVVEIGRLDNGSYKQKLIFNGKVDLGADPPTVIGISATYPASNLVGVFSELKNVSPSLLDTLRPTVTFYGPLYDAKGQRIALKTKIDPIDLKDGLKPDQVEGLIKGIGDLIRKR